MLERITTHFSGHVEIIEKIKLELTPLIAQSARVLSTALTTGGKVLIMGNGGSAADAQHFAAELVGRFRQERRPLPALALTTDSSVLTAIGNDYGFEQIFSRQVVAFAGPSDVVIGISTSGNSSNVLLAMQTARKAGCATIGLLGRDGGRIAAEVDLALIVPALATSHIQEAHLVIVHLLCDLVESVVLTTME